MTDSLEIFHTFATEVAAAMNDADITRTDAICAVMALVSKGPGDPPIGGSINYNDETEKWEVEAQISRSERCDEV